MRTLYGIQYLRAFAAVAVVIFHAAERNGLHFAIGAAGVDVFFVVSGFIMMAISERRTMRPAAFMRDRLLRIAPSYWIVTGIMIFGALIGLFPNLQLEFWHVVGSFLFVPVPSPNGGYLWPVLVQGWTLNYEMFFYLLFAASLFLRPRLRLPALLAVLGTAVMAGTLQPTGNPQTRFYAEPLVLEFAAGALFSKLWTRGYVPPPTVGSALVGMSIAGFAAIHFLKLEFDALTCGPLAAALVAGVLSIESGGRLPRMPVANYLGDASYSIYLWHTLAISVAVKAGAVAGMPALAIAAVGVIAGILIGVVAYECVEKPLQSLVKGRLSILWRKQVRRAVP
ncbi:acyltransferase [Pseudorhizobium endolithicum]|uniref:Acyltransferase n=1 Tax=Pseudorhizobium endolithicum TaxID=1191678 RepID=A0ABM8PMR1_9HYPH|nr:acyltransferase [Pseudorhizobium endolithicum]CAD7038407.1 acyltransferase [Pseudorhizobium endolithicum]